MMKKIKFSPRIFLAMIFVFAAITLWSREVRAHPHVFIQATCEIIYDDNGIRVIRVKWHYDSSISQMFIEDIDIDRNGIISDEEQKNARECYAAGYIRDKFYTTITSDEKPVPFEFKFMRADLDDGKAVFSMEIIPSIKFGNKKQKFSLSFRDLSFFTAISFNNKATPKVSRDCENKDTPYLMAEVDDKLRDTLSILIGGTDTGENITPPESELGILAKAIKLDIPGVTIVEKTAPSAAPAKTDSTFSTINSSMGLWQSFMALQAKYNEELHSRISGFKEKLNGKMLLMLFLFSGLYGLVHSAGPGHGKTLVVGYFLRHKSGIGAAPVFALAIAMVHTSTAVALALLFHTILKSCKGMERLRLQANMSFGIAVIILVFGIWLLATKIMNKDKHAGEGLQNSKKNMLKIALLAGIIPCPLSITVMLLTIPAGMLGAGLLAVGGIAAGTAALLSCAGLAAITMRGGLERFSENRGGAIKMVYSSLDYIGAALIISLGIALCLLYLPRF